MSKVDMDLVARLEAKAIDIRKDLAVYCNKIGVSHMGGPLSMCDMAVALYYHFMNYNPQNYAMPDRDRFVLSKGHCACLLYNIFTDMGMFTKEELYGEYNKPDGRFGQHPNRQYLPMFEASTGSLGHGLSLATGIALGARANKENYRVFCMVGDGELDEGSNWEAIMAAAHYKLSNLVLIVDRNGISGSRRTEETMSLESLPDKLTAFNFDVKVINGNDMEQIIEVLSDLPARDYAKERKPVAIVSQTIKGKGIDYMEDQFKWHLGGIDDEMLEKALESIEKTRKVRG